MKTRTHIAFALASAVLMLALLASCRTTAETAEPAIPVSEEFRPEPSPAPVPAPEPEPEPIPEPKPEPEPEPIPEPEPETPPATWSTGSTGPDGGIVFECRGTFLEAAEPVCEAGPYDEAKALVTEPWRIPDTAELQAIYTLLVESGLWDIEPAYFWSCEEMEDGSVAVMNFDTGFTGRFYRDMDFPGIIPVRNLE